MRRYENPFSVRSRYPTDPAFAAIGNTLATALFGNPEARAEQEYQNARTASANAQAQQQGAHAQLYKNQAERQRIENDAVSGLPGLIERLFIPPAPAPTAAPADLILAPAGLEGVGQAIAEALPAETGLPAPQVWDERMPRIGPRDPLDRGPNVQTQTIEQLRPGLPALIGALIQGEVSNPDELVGTIMALYGDDEAARRGMVGRGATPGAAFALTPERADDIREQGFDAQMDRAQLTAETTRRGQDIASRDRRRGQDIGSTDRHRGQDLQHGVTPVENGRAVAEQLFPGIHITQVERDPNSELGRANPNSWHTRSRGAIDSRPIPGMTFDQYVQRYRDAGYEIIESRDEVNNPSGHATGPHWHVVVGQRRGRTARAGGTGGRPAQPRQVSRAAIQAIDEEIANRLGASVDRVSAQALRVLRQRASVIYQRTGNPVEAVNTAYREMIDLGRRGGRPQQSANDVRASVRRRARQQPAAAAPQRIRYDANGNRIPG